jgi:hypothetical protein
VLQEKPEAVKMTHVQNAKRAIRQLPNCLKPSLLSCAYRGAANKLIGLYLFFSTP